MDRQSLTRQLASELRDACACQKVREASRKITRLYDEALRPAGIKVTQFTMLVVVALMEKATLTEMAEQLGMDRTTLTRNLKPLERAGLVEVSDEGYRRARQVNLTDQGAAALERALPLWRQAQSVLKARMGEEAWTRMQAGLDEARHRL